MKQFYHCGLYQYQLTIVCTHLQPKQGVVWSPLIATWRLQHQSSAGQAVTSRFTALRQKYNRPFAKYCCSAFRLWNVAHKCTLKELTTMERTSWQTERTHGLNQGSPILILQQVYQLDLSKNNLLGSTIAQMYITHGGIHYWLYKFINWICQKTICLDPL